MLDAIWRWMRSLFFRPQAVIPVALGEPFVAIDKLPAKPKQTPEEAAASRQRRAGLKARKRVATDVWEILGRFEKLSLTSKASGTYAADNSRAMETLLGCDFYFLDETIESTASGQDIAFFVDGADDLLRSVGGSLDTAIVTRKSDHYQIQRVTTLINRAPLRGKASIVPVHCVHVSVAHLYDNGRWWAESRYAGLINNKWVRLDTLKRVVTDSAYGQIWAWNLKNKKQAEELDRSIRVAFGVAVTMRYSWHVAFGPPNGPRVLLPTTPSGCLGTFKDRALKPGETRRSALRHWVRNHYRTVSEQTLAYVRDHLRGCTIFTWKDLECELLVSAYDLERNELFKQQADQWRAARKHNRVRVKLKRRV